MNRVNEQKYLVTWIEANGFVRGCKLSSQSFSRYTPAKELFEWHKNPTYARTVRYCILIDLTHGIVIDHFENEPVKV